MTANDEVKKTDQLQIVPVLDVGDLKSRLCALILDSMQDPMDRFNVNGNFTELPGDDLLKNDWHSEHYLMVKGGVDAGYFRIVKSQVQRLATLLFYLKKDFRANGILTDTVPFVGRRVFQELGYNKIEAQAWETNGVAIKIYERWMKQEGLLRDHGYFEGQYVDQFWYGCTYEESDFKRVKK